MKSNLETALHTKGGADSSRSALPPARRVLLSKLAPPAPPCFSDRLVWLEYLVEMQASLKVGERGPLDMRHSEPQFNYGLDFCADCSARHAMAMQKEHRCVPDHLLGLAVEVALS